MLLLPAVAQEIAVAPKAAKVYVVGNVKKPGLYDFDAKEGMTVLEAIARSEGLLPYAKKQAYIYRRDANQEREQITVDLSKIMDRKRKDVALQAGDILYVPGDKQPFKIPVDWVR